jgi:hypothetical protein
VPVFNAELAAKVQEKRLDAVEKLARELATQVGQDDSALVLRRTNEELEALKNRFEALEKNKFEALEALKNKFEALESIVQEIIQTRGESKVQALEKIVKLMHEKMPDEALIQRISAAQSALSTRQSEERHQEAMQRQQETVDRLMSEGAADIERRQKVVVEEMFRIQVTQMQQRLSAEINGVNVRLIALESKR